MSAGDGGVPMPSPDVCPISFTAHAAAVGNASLSTRTIRHVVDVPWIGPTRANGTR